MKGRYAPSPTGTLHLGNLRTALGAWLFARAGGSPFLLRIEDLDPERCRREYEQSQLADLRALGLDWDGEPLRQSERTEHYRDAFHTLVEQERVYPCWCTRAELREAALAPHADSAAGGYPGTCRALNATQRTERERRSGRPPAWRLDARAEVVGFEDLLHGAVCRPVDDFVLWRGDGVAAYNLAVVVDDAAQGVEQVVRGDDLLAGTPRQLLLGRLLGVPELRYAHLPLVLGRDGRRLAKRDGAVTLAERLALGETVEQLVGWMLEGLGVGDPGECLSALRALERFDASLLSTAPSVIDAAICPLAIAAG
jgi:glutamyl-tRNA synthetase